MLTRLSDATLANSGGKAATLGLLQREGLPVPDGFVVLHNQSHRLEVGLDLRDAVALELARLDAPVVAVRSSAVHEDTPRASAAGQYKSVIGARGIDQVCEAIATCWASLRTARVSDYWTRTGGNHAQSDPGMAVLVQRVIEAEASGVMFTPQQPEEPIRIEASWGLGLPVADGTVTPDTYEVAPDDTISWSPGRKQFRTDVNLERGGLVSNTVTPGKQRVRVLDDETIAALANLGLRIAEILDGPQDIEWAIARDTPWILQARPITAPLPLSRLPSVSIPANALSGTPGSHGVVTAAARIVRGPSDFSTVCPGEIIICPYTAPSWTPLFSIAAGVVTEAGGALSHAAIVAREYGIPAVIGVEKATSYLQNGARLVLDGTAGTVTVL